MSGVKRIYKNFISAWISRGFKLITGLLIVPVFLHHLGKDVYGLIIVLGSILSFSTLADLGIRSSLVRYMVISVNKKDDQQLNEYINTAAIMYFIICMVLCVSLFFSAGLLCDTFKVSPDLRSTTILLLRTYGIVTLFLSFTTPIFTAITSSQNRYDISNYRESISGVLGSLALLIAVNYFHIGIIGWAVITTSFSALTSISIFYVGIKLMPSLKFGFRYFKKQRIVEILKFGSIITIGGWSRMMKVDSDPLVLSSIYSPAEVSLYRSGVTIPANTRPLIAALVGQLHTFSTGIYTQNDNEKFKKLFEKGSKFTLLMGSCAMLFFVLLGPDLIRLWLHKNLSAADMNKVILCMQGMALIDFCFYIEGSSYAILYAMNKLRFMTFTDIFLGLFNLLSSYLIAKYSGWGAPSVILPTIVIEGIARPFYLFYTGKKIGFETGNIFSKILFPSICVIGITLLSVLGIGHYITSANPIIALGIKSALYAIPLLLSMWFIALNAEDKKLFRSVLKK